MECKNGLQIRITRVIVLMHDRIVYDHPNDNLVMIDSLYLSSKSVTL